MLLIPRDKATAVVNSNMLSPVVFAAINGVIPCTIPYNLGLPCTALKSAL